MADLLLYGDAAIRATDALLRTNGGRGVLLRIAAPAIAGAQGEELGLATPQFQDCELAPVAFRKAGNSTTLLVSASAVAALVGAGSVSLRAFDSAEVLFATAVGVVVDDVLYVIKKAMASQVDGVAYCYALTLQAKVQ